MEAKPASSSTQQGVTSMQKTAYRARKGLCVLAALPLVFAMASATAAGPSDLSPAVRQAMQSDLGMNNAQLAQYLQVECLSLLESTPFEQAPGPRYARRWHPPKAPSSEEHRAR